MWSTSCVYKEMQYMHIMQMEACNNSTFEFFKNINIVIIRGGLEFSRGARFGEALCSVTTQLQRPLNMQKIRWTLSNVPLCATCGCEGRLLRSTATAFHRVNDAPTTGSAIRGRLGHVNYLLAVIYSYLTFPNSLLDGAETTPGWTVD